MKIKFNYQNIFLSTLSGVLLGISFPPFQFGFIVFFSLVPFLLLLEKLEKKIQVVRYTYVTLLIFHIITIFWMGGWSSKTDIFMMIGSIGLILIHPFFYLIPVGLYLYIKKNISYKWGLFSLPFLWVALEYFRSIEETAFPWLTIGNALTYNLALMQIVSIFGVWGISFIIITINVLLYVAYKNFKNKDYRFTLNKLAIIIIILLIQFIYGKFAINEGFSSGEEIKVGIVQPNLDPWEKWQIGSLDSLLNLYFELSDSCINNGADLIVWPETALPVYLLAGRFDSEVSRILKYVSEKNVHILTGLPLLEILNKDKDLPSDAKMFYDSSYYYRTYNGTVLFEPNKNVTQKYGKMILVPFSERSPYLESIPFLGKLINWSVGIGNWNVGQEKTIFKYPINETDTARFAALVCYESIFPKFVSDFSSLGANFYVIVTNDSWFGELSGPEQHKQFSIFRAIENRRWVVRCANGGISCFIDPYGKVYYETKLYQKTFIVNTVNLENTTTFYTKYKDLICYLSLIITFLMTILTFIKKRIKNK